MGEAKRRAGYVRIGSTGPHAEHARTGAATERAMAVLFPIVTELARCEGDWAGVFNALETLLVNLQIEMTGVAETERVMRELIKHLPEFARAQQLAAETRGSA